MGQLRNRYSRRGRRLARRWRVLQAGDELSFNEQNYQVSRRVGWAYRSDYQKTPVIGLMHGFQYDAFPMSAREAFCYEDYEVTKDSDRMGIRLSGKALEYNGEGLVSEGVNVGLYRCPQMASLLL